MREKGKRLIAIILSCLLLLSNVTVYAATEAEEQSDTQNTVSVNASEEVVTLSWVEYGGDQETTRGIRTSGNDYGIFYEEGFPRCCSGLQRQERASGHSDLCSGRLCILPTETQKVQLCYERIREK